MEKTKLPQSGDRPAAASQTLDELARDQGIVPIANLDELGALWPADDDPERLDQFLSSERARRRATAR
jgi:hypothetical protein